MRKLLHILIAATSLASCSSGAESNLAPSDPNYAEMEELKAWGRQLKADDPDTARLLVRNCWDEGSLSTPEGKLAVARCMRRKYDEGVRA